MNKNIIVDGVLNVGKTKNVIFPLVEEMIDRKESFIVSDSKREYYNYFSEKARKNGYNVCVINIANPSMGNSFDLFELPYKYYKDGKKDESYRLLDILVKNICMNNESSDPFWGMSASSLILAILVKIMEEGSRDELNFKSVYNVLTKFSKLDNKLLNNYFNTPNNIIYQGANSILCMPPETKESVIAVSKQLLFDNIIYDDTLNMIGKSYIKQDDIDKKPTAMFVITSNIDYGKNVVFNMILSEMEYMFRSSFIKLNVILDNFDELNIYNFKAMFTSSNSYGINIALATRDIDRLVKWYGDYLFKVSDVLYVDDEKIKRVFAGKEEIFDNRFTNTKVEEKELPQLEIEDIKTFNLYEHVSSELINSIAFRED